MKDVPEVGPLEFRLLRILWRRNPLAAREVMEEYNSRSGREVKYTTVMTLLTRMAEKGVLKVDRSRQPFHFSPAVSREQMIRHRLGEFVDLFFEGRPLDLAVRLVESNPPSEGEIERLEKLLERYRDPETEAKGAKDE